MIIATSITDDEVLCTCPSFRQAPLPYLGIVAQLASSTPNRERPENSKDRACLQ